MERFILEMGKGFAFVERQKRMIIDDEDFHLDLLFFHRTLKRLVAIELIGNAQRRDYDSGILDRTASQKTVGTENS